jgi:hypothetical protein
VSRRERLQEHLHDEKGTKLPGTSLVRGIAASPALFTRPGMPLEGPRRTLPDFLVVGSTRCGSTSIYHYLTAHPAVAPAVRKEIHFFDNQFSRGVGWYRRQFPSLVLGPLVARVRRRAFATGESTPYYLFHPHAARRVAAVAPAMRLVALVRDPVDRAWGDYHNKVARGFETLSFAEALDAEDRRLAGEVERMAEDESYYSFAHQHFTYRAKGRYSEQLERWLSYFPREQLLVLRSEDLYADPTGATRSVASFLGLPDWRPTNRDEYHRRPKPRMDPGLRRELAAYYAPWNRRLGELLGTDPGWPG